MAHPSPLAPLLALLALTACTKPPQLTGTVTDVWGKPIEGATVKIDGSVEQATTDIKGHFSMPAPEKGARLMAGKRGYIHASKAVPAPAPDEEPKPVHLELYPEPDKPGFYAVAHTGYKHLQALKVQTRGTQIGAYTGLADIGSVELGHDKPLKFVFVSTLRPSELSQLGLQLEKLKFNESAQVPGVLGAQPVKLNLWVADTSVPFDLKGLSTENDYLITTRTPLAPGVYAFHTQDILTTQDVNALDKLPKEMQVAYPFEVK